MSDPGSGNLPAGAARPQGQGFTSHQAFSPSSRAASATSTALPTRIVRGVLTSDTGCIELRSALLRVFVFLFVFLSLFLIAAIPFLSPLQDLESAANIAALRQWDQPTPGQPDRRALAGLMAGLPAAASSVPLPSHRVVLGGAQAQALPPMPTMPQLLQAQAPPPTSSFVSSSTAGAGVSGVPYVASQITASARKFRSYYPRSDELHLQLAAQEAANVAALTLRLQDTVATLRKHGSGLSADDASHEREAMADAADVARLQGARNSAAAAASASGSAFRLGAAAGAGAGVAGLGFQVAGEQAGSPALASASGSAPAAGAGAGARVAARPGASTGAAVAAVSSSAPMAEESVAGADDSDLTEAYNEEFVNEALTGLSSSAVAALELMAQRCRAAEQQARVLQQRCETQSKELQQQQGEKAALGATLMRSLQTVEQLTERFLGEAIASGTLPSTGARAPASSASSDAGLSPQGGSALPPPSTSAPPSSLSSYALHSGASSAVGAAVGAAAGAGTPFAGAVTMEIARLRATCAALLTERDAAVSRAATASAECARLAQENASLAAEAVATATAAAQLRHRAAAEDKTSGPLRALLKEQLAQREADLTRALQRQKEENRLRNEAEAHAAQLKDALDQVSRCLARRSLARGLFFHVFPICSSFSLYSLVLFAPPLPLQTQAELAAAHARASAVYTISASAGAAGTTTPLLEQQLQRKDQELAGMRASLQALTLELDSREAYIRALRSADPSGRAGAGAGVAHGQHAASTAAIADFEVALSAQSEFPCAGETVKVPPRLHLTTVLHTLPY